MLKSNDIEQIISASAYIGEMGDTSVIKELIYNSYDMRISHDIRHYGLSVYKAKMLALKKLTKAKPPKKITYLPDSAIVKFYFERSKKHGWIK